MSIPLSGSATANLGTLTATPTGVSFLPVGGGTPAAGVQRDADGASTSSSSTAPSAGGGGLSIDGMKPEDIEKLLDKIFPRLRLRLRSELLSQRERAGLLHDTRSLGAR